MKISIKKTYISFITLVFSFIALTLANYAEDTGDEIEEATIREKISKGKKRKGETIRQRLQEKMTSNQRLQKKIGKKKQEKSKGKERKSETSIQQQETQTPPDTPKEKELDIEASTEESLEGEQEKQVAYVGSGDVITTLKNDTDHLKWIALKILDRPQDQTIMREAMAKHGSEGYEIWQKLKYGFTWSEKTEQLSPTDKTTLENLFGSLRQAKMKINRENYIVAKKIISSNPVGKAKHVCKKGSVELIEDPANPDRPFSIKCTIQEAQATGTLYTKNKENVITSQDLTKIYVTFNISDIVTKIQDSNKTAWEKRKMDWDQKIDGRVTTITPTE